MRVVCFKCFVVVVVTEPNLILVSVSEENAAAVADLDRRLQEIEDDLQVRNQY